MASAGEQAVLLSVAISTLSATTGAIAVYPADVVKTRLQNQSTVDVRKLTLNNATAGLHSNVYRNSIDCFRKMAKSEGVFSFYKGMLTFLGGQVPEKAVRLFVVDAVRNHAFSATSFTPNDPSVKYATEFAAGATAGTVQVIITNPSELIKVKSQLNPTTAPLQALRNHIRTKGIFGLYTGASACFFRDITFSATYFPSYLYLKELNNRTISSHLSTLIAGCAAGMISAALATPADVVKTRLQAQHHLSGTGTQYTGLLDCLGKIYSNEGGRAFFKGLGPRVIRTSPQYGLMLLTYETLQGILMGHSNT